MSNSSSFFASKSYQRMTKALFYFSAFFSLSGLIFKIQHYPGSDILLPVGLMFLSIVSVLLTLEPISSENESHIQNNKLFIFHRYLLGFGSAIFSIGGLFYIQHYPGGYMLSSIGLLLSLFCLIFSIYLSFSNKNSGYSASKLNSIFLLTFFIWGASGYFMRVSKSVLWPYVSLNSDMQDNASNEMEFGDRQIELFKSNNATDVKKLEFVNQIDNLTAEHIKYLDALKIEILTEIGEDPIQLKPGPEGIITNNYDGKFPLRPIVMDLRQVRNKDKFDEVMRIFGIANSIENPESYKCKSSNVSGGIDLWNSLLKFRGELCSALVKSSSNDSVKYNFVDPKVTKYKDLADLQKTLATAFKKSKISPEDYADVEEIYITLSKNEQWKPEFFPSGVHWLGKTFDHAPAIAAICVLSNLQKEALSARKIAVQSILNK